MIMMNDMVCALAKTKENLHNVNLYKFNEF